MKTCQRCNKERDASLFCQGRNTCRPCKTELHYAWIERNKAKYAKYMKSYREKHSKRLSENGIVHRRKAKLDAVRHYSNGSMVCKCCGESEIDFLTIDHVNGGGTKERKSTGRGGQSFAIWLRKQGYPKGFQILCYNCNCAKAFCKVCPHERIKNVALVQ